MIHKLWSVLLVMSLAYASDNAYEDLGIGPDQQPRFSTAEPISAKQEKLAQQATSPSARQPLDHGREELGISPDQYPGAFDQHSGRKAPKAN